MNIKKNRDYDLERLRTPLKFLGLLFASAVALAMLEWRVPEERPVSRTYDRPTTLIDEVVFTAIPEKAKPPAPKPKERMVVDLLTIIDDSPNEEPYDDFPTWEEPVISDIPKIIEEVAEEVVLAPDVMPEFPGGLDAMRAYLSSQLQYPSWAKQADIQGKVWIEFLVNKKGEIKDVKVVRGIGGGCDEEALRVVLQMPQWTPGKQHGMPVNVRYHLPVSFTLRN